MDKSRSCDLAKNPMRRSGFDAQMRKANSNDFGSTSTSSSQTKTAWVPMKDRGKNRALRLLDGWRSRETDAVPKEEIERLWASCFRTCCGVVGFPQRTTTEDTSGDAAYVAEIDWRRGMRDSE